MFTLALIGSTHRMMNKFLQWNSALAQRGYIPHVVTLELSWQCTPEAQAIKPLLFVLARRSCRPLSVHDVTFPRVVSLRTVSLALA